MEKYYIWQTFNLIKKGELSNRTIYIKFEQPNE